MRHSLQSGDPKAAISTFTSLYRAFDKETVIDANDTAANAPLASQGFDKVAGMQALKKLLWEEVVRPVRDPEPYRHYGLSILTACFFMDPDVGRPTLRGISLKNWVTISLK